MKIKSLLFVLLSIVVLSCDKKNVKLPVLNVSGIQDTIYDNSQIWMFFKLQKGDTIAELNRRNTISTTNWIYNIDKRLPLRLVIPHLKKLIEKREKPAMHPKDADDTNYFSYVDSGSNTLSTVQFDVINFITDTTINKSAFTNDNLNKHLFMDYRKNGIYVNDSILVINQLNKYLDEQSDSIPVKLHLNFDGHLHYGDYLYLKATLQNVKNDSISIDKNEYVY